MKWRTRLRFCILACGPLAVVVGLLALSSWLRPEAGAADVRNDVLDQDASLEGDPDREPSAEDASGREASESSQPAALEPQCELIGANLRRQLGAECAIVLKPPLVLAGDLTSEQLEHWCNQTVEPAMRAMANSYFQVAPNEPITVLLFSNEDSYDHYARLMFDDEGISIFGYYKPACRTLVMNIKTGSGTLVHELTHALMDFDFPDVPDWFNEGLASLHEQCRFRENDRGIDGLVNWRLPMLQKAIQEKRLRSLDSLIRTGDFRGSQEALNYAQARYFCMYLQQEGLLEDFYKTFRDQRAKDKWGDKSVRQVTGRALQQLDTDFQQWVMQLKPQ